MQCNEYCVHIVYTLTIQNFNSLTLVIFSNEHFIFPLMLFWHIPMLSWLHTAHSRTVSAKNCGEGYFYSCMIPEKDVCGGDLLKCLRSTFHSAIEPTSLFSFYAFWVMHPEMLRCHSCFFTQELLLSIIMRLFGMLGIKLRSNTCPTHCSIVSVQTHFTFIINLEKSITDLFTWSLLPYSQLLFSCTIKLLYQKEGS